MMKKCWRSIKTFVSSHIGVIIAVLVLAVLANFAFSLYDDYVVLKYGGEVFTGFDDNKKYFEITAKEVYEFYNTEVEKDSEIKYIGFIPSSDTKWEVIYYDSLGARAERGEFLLPPSMKGCRDKIIESLTSKNIEWRVEAYDGFVCFENARGANLMYSMSWGMPDHDFSEGDYFISRKGLHWFNVLDKRT